jgi:nickel-dependent lactate racemase
MSERKSSIPVQLVDVAIQTYQNNRSAYLEGTENFTHQVRHDLQEGGIIYAWNNLVDEARQHGKADISAARKAATLVAGGVAITTSNILHKGLERVQHARPTYIGKRAIGTAILATSIAQIIAAETVASNSKGNNSNSDDQLREHLAQRFDERARQIENDPFNSRGSGNPRVGINRRVADDLRKGKNPFEGL